MSILRRRLMMADHYVGGGLLLHLDGINNTGHGHDPNPAVWTDLSGNGHDATLTRRFDGDLFGDRYLDGDLCWGESDLGNAPAVMTVECVVRSITDPWSGPTEGLIISDANISTIYAISDWGASGWTQYSSLTDNLNREYAGQIFYKACSGTGNPVYFNGIQDDRLDNVPGGRSRIIQLACKNDQKNERIVRAQIYAVRVYDRVLSADEVAHNYAVDKARFGL